MKHDYVYMLVSHDELETPLAVANSAKELAAIVGVSENSVMSAIHHNKRGRNKFSRYVQVDVLDAEIEEGEI